MSGLRDYIVWLAESPNHYGPMVLALVALVLAIVALVLS
jgi:hypothetical protein